MIKRILKYVLPKFLTDFLSGTYVAFVTPVLYSIRTGHFKSAYKMMSVDRHGKPIPWYTYPCVDFLKRRNYEDKTVLEFGGGQSTLWWAKRAKHVVVMEGNEGWLKKLEARVGGNVDLHLVNNNSGKECFANINEILDQNYSVNKFDIIIIDGLWRDEISDIASKVMAPDGIIIYDNSDREGEYIGNCYEKFKNSGLSRIDFFGYLARTTTPLCTSVFFHPRSFIVSSNNEIIHRI